MYKFMGAALLDTTRSLMTDFCKLSTIPFTLSPRINKYSRGIWFLSLLPGSREGARGWVREDGMENLLQKDKTQFLCSLKA